jgi:hypothetical protein
MPRKKWPKTYAALVFAKTNGACYHCKKKLKYEPRTGWHIDHHPVVHRDIEGQVCCGVTDTLDLDNLQPSCVQCNVSHEHEKEHAVYCGGTQFPCKKWVWSGVARAVVAVALVATSSGVTYAAATYAAATCG